MVVENLSLDGVMHAPAGPTKPSVAGSPSAVRALKADGDGEVVVLGSGNLMHQQAAAGLVDQ